MNDPKAIEAFLREGTGIRLHVKASPRTRLRGVEAGTTLVIGLQGGARLEGRVARRCEDAIVLEPARPEEASVVVLERAIAVAQVVREDAQ